MKVGWAGPRCLILIWKSGAHQGWSHIFKQTIQNPNLRCFNIIHFGPLISIESNQHTPVDWSTWATPSSCWTLWITTRGVPASLNGMEHYISRLTPIVGHHVSTFFPSVPIILHNSCIIFPYDFHLISHLHAIFRRFSQHIPAVCRWPPRRWIMASSGRSRRRACPSRGLDIGGGLIMIETIPWIMIIILFHIIKIY